jgi:hypothetical protein
MQAARTRRISGHINACGVVGGGGELLRLALEINQHQAASPDRHAAVRRVLR